MDFLEKALEKLASTRKKVENSISSCLQELNDDIQNIKVYFEDKKCLIFIDYLDPLGIFDGLISVYRQLFKTLSIYKITDMEWLIIKKYIPEFYFIQLIQGKQLNNFIANKVDYIFFLEKGTNGVENLNIFPKDLDEDTISTYKLESWESEFKQLIVVRKNLEDLSNLKTLITHILQLKPFSKLDKLDKIGKSIINDYISKTGKNVQELFQSLIDFTNILAEYSSLDIDDLNFRLEFGQLVLQTYKLIYIKEPTEKNEQLFSLEFTELEKWEPNLEKALNNMFILYLSICKLHINYKISI